MDKKEEQMEETTKKFKTSISIIINPENGKSCFGTLYFLLKENENFVIKKADLENNTEKDRVSTQSEVSKLFCNYLEEKIVENEDLEIANLSSDDEQPNAIYKYDYEEFPEELKIIKEIDSKKLNDSKKFDFKKDDLSKLFGYVICLGTMDKNIILFKKFYNISLIKRDSFLLGFIPEKTRLEKIEAKDILRLNGVVEVLKTNDELYILNLSVVEKSLGFTKILEKDADKFFDKIEKMGLLDNIETLKDLKDDKNSISFLKQMVKAINSSLVLKKNISKENIIKFCQDKKLKFTYNKEETKFNLSTKKSKKEFLKLLNDSFLTSDLTEGFYDANSKKNIGDS